MALMPVWTGVSTPWRTITPGAMRSTGRVFVVRRGPLSSSGRPRGSTTRPRRAWPDRDLHHAAGRLDRVAFLDARGIAQDDGADRLLLEVEGHAVDIPGELQQLRGERVREAVDLGDPVADLDDGARPSASRQLASNPSMAALMMVVMSSERMAM